MKNSTKSKQKFWPFRQAMFLLLGIVLALGIIDPFSLTPAGDDGIASGGSRPIQFFQAMFVIFLFFWNHKDSTNFFCIRQINKPLLIFFFILLLSSIIHDIPNFPITFFIKFVLLLGYCYLLPNIIAEDTRLNFCFFIGFFATGFAIGLAYCLGLLDPFITLHESGRVFIFNENCNSTSGRLALGILCLFFCLDMNYLSWGKWRYCILVLTIPMLILIFASGSRGSFIILCLSILTYLYIKNKNQNGNAKGFIYTLLAMIGIGGVLYFVAVRDVNSVMIERLMGTIKDHETGGRDKLASNTLSIFYDNFLLGAGVNGYKKEMFSLFHETRVAHNLFYHVLGISGVLGFIPLCIFFFKCFKNAWKCRHRSVIPISLYVFIFLLALKTGGVLEYLLMWVCISFINGISLEKQ